MKEEEDVDSKLKKGRIIEILRKIRDLQDTDVNEQLHILLMSTNKRIKEKSGQMDKGILVLLEFWGSPME
jgi:hypothetical protein